MPGCISRYSPLHTDERPCFASICSNLDLTSAIHLRRSNNRPSPSALHRGRPCRPCAHPPILPRYVRSLGASDCFVRPFSTSRDAPSSFRMRESARETSIQCCSAYAAPTEQSTWLRFRRHPVPGAASARILPARSINRASHNSLTPRWFRSTERRKGNALQLAVGAARRRHNFAPRRR